MPVDYHTLVFSPPPVDVDDDGVAEDMEFHFQTNMRQEYQTITDFLAEGGSGIIAVLSDVISSIDGGNRQTFKIDAGAGEHIISATAEVSKDSTLRWGTGDGDPVTDATGDGPVKQLQLLDRTLQTATIDSRANNSATVEIGDYSTAGAFEPLDVAFDNPSGVFDAETESSTATVDIAFIEIGTLRQPIDARQRGAE